LNQTFYSQKKGDPTGKKAERKASRLMPQRQETEKKTYGSFWQDIPKNAPF
jgi:hypothetical protein